MNDQKEELYMNIFRDINQFQSNVPHFPRLFLNKTIGTLAIFISEYVCNCELTIHKNYVIYYKTHLSIAMYSKQEGLLYFSYNLQTNKIIPLETDSRITSEIWGEYLRCPNGTVYRLS